MLPIPFVSSICCRITRFIDSVFKFMEEKCNCTLQDTGAPSLLGSRMATGHWHWRYPLTSVTEVQCVALIDEVQFY